MQTTKQTTSPGKRAKDYVTIALQASRKVTGFEQLSKDLERAINVSGKSTSTFTNYSPSSCSSCAALQYAAN